MIKGVNRRIVEINAKGGAFDKAILYVRPGCTSLNEEELRAEAEYYMESLTGLRRAKRCRPGLPELLIALSAAAAGALISAMLIILFL